MIRAAIAVAPALAFAGIAHAESSADEAATSAPSKPDAPYRCDDCDEIADIESREANLESNERREGLTFGIALGGGLTLGGDVGVGRGPATSLRLGHVATRKTIITFEIVGTGALHKRAVMSDLSETLTDNNVGLLFVGAQRYTKPSLWLRASGGLVVLNKNANLDGTGGDPARGGIGGLVGIGYEYARFPVPLLGSLVLGVEAFSLASLTGDGLKINLAFNPLCIAFY